MNDIAATLAERGNRYGDFPSHARITQRLKQEMRQTRRWDGLSYDQQEALDMVAHKIGRILNGDPDYVDSWHDIIGYTKLVEDRLIAAQALDSVSDDPIYRAALADGESRPSTSATPP